MRLRFVRSGFRFRLEISRVISVLAARARIFIVGHRSQKTIGCADSAKDKNEQRKNRDAYENAKVLQNRQLQIRLGPRSGGR